MKYTPPIKFTFDKKKHLYQTEDGKFLTGVTNILKNLSKGDAFPAWGAKMTAEYIQRNFRHITENNLTEVLKEAKGEWRRSSDIAKKVGSAVHNFIEEFYKGSNPDLETYLQALDLPSDNVLEVERCITAFLDWNTLKSPKIIFSELRVVSKKYNFAGTLDFLFEIDGKLVLGDFKTSKARKSGKVPYKEYTDARSIYPDYWLQLAAYQIALEEGGIIPEERMTVRFDKKTGKAHYFTAPTDLKFDKETFIKLREIHKWVVWTENNLN